MRKLLKKMGGETVSKRFGAATGNFDAFDGFLVRRTMETRGEICHLSVRTLSDVHSPDYQRRNNHLSQFHHTNGLK